MGAALATGNRATIARALALKSAFADLPDTVSSRITWLQDLPSSASFSAVLIEPGGNDAALLQAIAAMEGPIPLVQSAAPDGSYRLEWLVEEQSTSINTTAAGGNASLMALV